MIHELEKGFGEGPLTLIVTCTKCDSNFELNKETVVLAMVMETTFIDYLRWIQSSKCSSCGENDNL